MFFSGQINASLYDSTIKALTRSTEKIGGDGIAALEAQANKWRDAIDPAREYYRQIEQIGELVGRGFLSKGEGSDATTSVLAKLETLQKRNAEETKTGIDLAMDFGVTFNSAFEEAVFGAGKLSGALKGLTNDIARLMFRKTAIEPFTKWILDGLTGAAGSGTLDISTTDLGIGSAAGKSAALPKSLGFDAMNEAMIARSSTSAAAPTIV